MVGEGKMEIGGFLNLVYVIAEKVRGN